MPSRYFLLSLLFLGSACGQYVDEPINESSIGFRLDSVIQESSGLIVITATARVLSDTAAYVYFPKAAGSITNLATNACASSTDICCLSTFDSQYSVSGNFASVKEAYCPLGTPNWGAYGTSAEAFNGELQSTDPTWSNAADIVLNTVVDSDSDGVGEPVVSIEPDGTYKLVYKFAHSILKDNLAIEEYVQQEQQQLRKYTSMVGVLFIRTSDTSKSVTIHAAQAEFEYTKSTGLFVSVATEQQRLALDDITFTFHNAVDSSSNAHTFVQMTVDYDTSVFEGYEIVATSLRYGAAASYGLVAPWTTSVCPATAPIWDDSCSEAWTYCDYTTTGMTSQFPFTGLDTMVGGNVYLQFTVKSTLVGGTNTVLSHILVEMAVDKIMPLESCQSITFEAQDISDLVTATATIGVGLNPLPLEGTTTDSLNQVNEIQTSGFGQSYSDALQLIELDAQEFLAKSYASDYKLVIDDVIVYNFLDVWGGTSNSDNTGYAAVLENIKNGNAFDVTEASGRFRMIPTSESAAETTCAYLPHLTSQDPPPTFNGCVWRHGVLYGDIDADSTTSVHMINSKDIDTDFNALKTASVPQWLKDNIFGSGDDVYMTEQVTNYLAAHCTNNGNAVTNGYACLWVDPGFKWLSAPLNLPNNPYTIADKTITAMVVSIRDATETAVARRLLSFESNDAMQNARRTLQRKKTLETIRAAMGSPHSIKPHLPKRHTVKGKEVVQSRHLLQTLTEEQKYMQDLPSHFAGSALVGSNKNVNPYVNTAVLTGHINKKWQYFRVKVPMGSATKQTLAHNFEMISSAASGKPGLLGGSLKIVDFLFSDTMNGRRLLESNDMTATAILGTDDYDETLILYKEYVKCLFTELRDVTTAYTTEEAKTEIVKCDNDLTLYETSLAVTLDITSNCGAGTQNTTAECNKVLALKYFEYPKIDFDPTIETTTVQPVLQFELSTSQSMVLTAATSTDEALLNNIRWSFAEKLGVNMDRVLVEVKERDVTAAARRLLEIEYYIVVSVFSDDRVGQLWPPEGTTASALYMTNKAAATTEIETRSSITFTAGDAAATPVAPPSPSSFPFRLQFSGMYNTDRSELLETDMINIGHSVNSLVPSVLGVAMHDVVVHNVRQVAQQVLFEVSVKALTVEDGCKLRTTADENLNAIQTQMTSWLRSLGYLKTIDKVTLQDLELKDSINKNIDCTNYTLTVVLIVVAVVLLGGGAFYMFYFVGEAKPAENGENPVTPADKKSRIAGNVIYTRIV